MLIIGCSRRKTAASAPLPALDLYQGGAVPDVRAFAADHPGWRRRIWIISAEHGLVHADTPLLPYDRRLDATQAAALRPMVMRTLSTDVLADGPPQHVLVLAEPLYLLVVADLPLLCGPGAVRWFTDPARDWEHAAELLNLWSPS